jgi:serine/threonine protein kinase/tetratricopeptide (TPR) repeat protein
MVCPNCGRETLAAHGHCTACGGALSNSAVATGTLTPPPADTPDPFDKTGSAPLDPDLTLAPGARLPQHRGPADPESAGTSIANANRIAAPQDDDLTIASNFSATGSRSHPPSATPPIADQTRLAGSFDADLTVAAGAGVPGTGPGAAPPARTPAPGLTTSRSAGKRAPLAPGEQFGPRYHLIRLLGIGGMGAVYQAWDAELGVAVALKVIRPEIAADQVAAAEIERRFKRELLLARKVTHKNVVRIHDLGEIDGIKYITMPYLDGSDLASILKEETKLQLPRALRIARGIVAGLLPAHEAGVVHRDLKPANIMVGPDNEPTIMDFGIARSSGGPGKGSATEDGARSSGLSQWAALAAGNTMAGTVVGTVEYMAPEQAKAQPVDQRGDIYAFGLMFYDMLIGGRRSQRAESAIAELQGRMGQAPPAPRTVDATVPVAIDAIISRCLEPDPAKRFQTTAELQAALERLDDKGKPLPIIRRLTRRTMAAAAVVVLLLLGGTFYTTKWLSAPTVEPDPITVVIADFQNSTNDPTFDNTLGQTTKRALESARFITAFDRAGIRDTFAAQPDKFDEVTARQFAVKQGLGVVLAGSIAPRGNGYDIAIQATQPMTGEVLASVTRRASSKDEVLGTVTGLVTNIRKALGDQTSDDAQELAMRSLSTTSLEVASHYAAATEAQSKGNFEEAFQSFQKAVQLDPEFGLGYQGLAVMSGNLGRLQDAEKYASEALRYLDGMTERERFQARGSYYIRTGDYRQCVKEYGDLILGYPADVLAHNQRALCLVYLRDLRGAVDAMQQAVKILPNQTFYRINLAVLLTHASDFAGAEREILSLQELDTRSVGTLAFSQLGQGRVGEAADTYKKLSTMSTYGASFAAAGLADLAVYEGRFSEAVRLFEQGAAADLAAKNPDGAAMKFTSLAYAHLANGQKRPAAAAAEKALLNSTSAPIRFLAGRIFVETGDLARARKLADGFLSQVAAEPQAYGKILEGGIALNNRDPRQAIKILSEANEILDTWLGHFDLGRAFFEAKAFPQADSEFDRCIQRRGEALALVFEDPTYGHLPIVYYYQGRVREEMKTAAFADSYREYLKIRGQSAEDPLLPEVRRRASN